MKKQKKNVYAAILLCILFSSCGKHSFDLTNQQEGQENPGFIPIESDQPRFIPYSEISGFDSGNLLITIPADTNSEMPVDHRHTGMKEIPVRPGSVYTLRLRAMGVEKLQLQVRGILKSGGVHTEVIPVLNTIFLLNVNGLTLLEKDFAVTGNADTMVPYLTFFSAQPGTILGTGTKLIINEFSISETGKMKRIPSALYGKNFIPFTSFSEFPYGSFTNMHLGSGKNAAKWPDVQAEITNLEGEKVLRISRKTNEYIYPFFTSIGFPEDPQKMLIRTTVTVKGNGTFRLGLWWKRNKFSTDYQNRIHCTLTDEWQTFTETRACLSPMVTAANVCFNAVDEGVMYVRDVRIFFVNPGE